MTVLKKKGWKTYAAAFGLVVLAIVDFANGNAGNGIEKLTAAFGLFGLRHAIEAS